MSVQRVSISTSCLNEVGGALCQVCTVSVFIHETYIIATMSQVSQLTYLYQMYLNVMGVKH